MDQPIPISFANHVVPIFSKLGCNGGGCHGKSGGQNGFALSLLGFVPELDYQTLVKENRGRRVLHARSELALSEGGRYGSRRRQLRKSAPMNTSSSAAGSPPACHGPTARISK